MGAPGFTEFCRNGHIIKSIPHHYIDISEDTTKCPFCDANEFAIVIEWLDEDHWGSEISVPKNPIGYEWVNVNNERFVGKQKIDIYDVSRLTRWNKK